MTLTEQKGNLRGREFSLDTGIDGNACEETTKDQRWVGLFVKYLILTPTNLTDHDVRLSDQLSSPPFPGLFSADGFS